MLVDTFLNHFHRSSFDQGANERGLEWFESPVQVKRCWLRVKGQSDPNTGCSIEEWTAWDESIRMQGKLRTTERSTFNKSRHTSKWVTYRSDFHPVSGFRDCDGLGRFWSRGFLAKTSTTPFLAKLRSVLTRSIISHLTKSTNVCTSSLNGMRLPLRRETFISRYLQTIFAGQRNTDPTSPIQEICYREVET